MPTNKHVAPASDKKAVIVFRQKILNTNNSSNGIKIGYIVSLTYGLIPVRKVNESSRMMMEARTRKVITNQNLFLLRNHL